MAASGAVAYQFHRKGQIAVPKSKIGEDDLMGLILDAGAEDMTTDEEQFTVTTAPDAFEKVKKAIEDKHIPIEHAELQMIPEITVHVEGKDAENLLKLIESLEDHDDIQHVYGNFDIDESFLANLTAG